MKPPEEAKRDLVRQWAARAEKDFMLAQHLMSEGNYFCEAIAFNCQQSAEKYLKAVLTLHQVGFPKTHNLGELLDLLAGINATLAGSLRSITALNPYGVEYRYPSDFPEMTQSDAEEAFRLAETARNAVLPELESYRRSSV